MLLRWSFQPDTLRRRRPASRRGDSSPRHDRPGLGSGRHARRDHRREPSPHPGAYTHAPGVAAGWAADEIGTLMAVNLLTPILSTRTRSINFFNGRLLAAEDLTSEQQYYRATQTLLGNAIGDGVVTGLEVSISPQSN